MTLFCNDKLIPYKLGGLWWNSAGLPYGNSTIYFVNKGAKRLQINTTKIRIDSGRYGHWQSIVSSSLDGSTFTVLYSGNNSAKGESGWIDIENYPYIAITRAGSEAAQEAEIAISVE